MPDLPCGVRVFSLQVGPLLGVLAGRCGTPQGIVEALSDHVIGEFTREEGVTPGGAIFLFRGNQGAAGFSSNVLRDLVLARAAAQHMKAEAAGFVASGTSLPNVLGDGNDAVQAAIDSGSVPHRVIVIAARARGGEMALRVLTPRLGGDGRVAGFEIEDAEQEELRGGPNPCQALAMVFEEAGNGGG